MCSFLIETDLSFPTLAHITEMLVTKALTDQDLSQLQKQTGVSSYNFNLMKFQRTKEKVDRIFMILKAKGKMFSQMLNAAISMEIYQQESGWKGPRYYFIIYIFIVPIFSMMQVSPQSDGGVCAAGQQTGAGPPQERGAGPGDWVGEGGGPEHHGAPPPHLPADKQA